MTELDCLKTDKTQPNSPKTTRQPGRISVKSTPWWRKLYRQHRLRYSNPFKSAYRIYFRLVFLGLLLTVGAASGLFAHFTYQRVQEQKAAAAATYLLAHEQYTPAWQSAQLACKFNPNNLAACRVLATISHLAKLSQELDWLQRVARAEPTLSNQLAVAACALRYQSAPYPLTAKILAELEPIAATNAACQELAAQLALKTQSPAVAEAHLVAAIRLNPASPQNQLDLAVLRLAATNAALRGESRLLLEKFSTNRGWALPALQALVTDRLNHQDWSAASNYSARLMATGQPTFDDILVNLELLQRLNSPDFFTRLQALQKNTATNAPAVTRLSFWMQDHGLLAANLKWLNGLNEDMQDSPLVKVAWTKAYAQNADWQSVKKFTSGGDWGSLDYIRLAALACAWNQAGVTGAADLNWLSAKQKAGKSFESLSNLWVITQQFPMPGEHRDLVRLLKVKYPAADWDRQLPPN